MKDEIKKINITFPGQILDYVDTKEHLLELFNYITNLQKENECLKLIDKLRIDTLIMNQKTSYDVIDSLFNKITKLELKELEYLDIINKMKLEKED